MSHTIPQKMAVLAYLKQGYGLTPLEALRVFKINCLAERIRDLRRMGWDITTTMVQVPSGKRVARYSLTNPQQQTPAGVPIPGRKAKPTLNAAIEQVERELEHTKGGKDWKEGARWAISELKKRM